VASRPANEYMRKCEKNAKKCCADVRKKGKIKISHRGPFDKLRASTENTEETVFS